MTDASARAAALLNEHRASIDRLDAILVYTLGERFKHTKAVGRLKAEHDLAPVGSRPARHNRSSVWKILPKEPTSTPNSPRLS